jgi:hypothetical protein
LEDERHSSRGAFAAKPAVQRHDNKRQARPSIVCLSAGIDGKSIGGEREIAEIFLNNLDLAGIVVSRAPHRGDTSDTKLPASDIATIPKDT